MNRDVRISRHAEANSFCKAGESMKFGFSEYVECDENVVKSCICHHLCLTKLLTCQSHRTSVDLHARDLRKLVRLNVRPVRDAVFIEVILQPFDVRLDPVKVYEDARRI